MIQRTFNQTEIERVIERIQDLGCDIWIEGRSLKLRGPEDHEAKRLFREFQTGLIAHLQGQRVNGFAESIEKADNPVARIFLDAVYQKAFYNFDQLIVAKSGDTTAQKKGSDVLIYTTSDRVYRVDEKIRPSRTNFSDIALEYEHVFNNNRKTPGWIEKDLGIDYLVYAFVPVRRAYLFPWQQLKAAWNKNKVEWLRLAGEKRDGFMIVPSVNPTYTTLSCAVPTGLLIEKVKEAIIVQL